VVGERRARTLEQAVPPGPGVQVIGDAVVPRRVHDAIAEGGAAAQQV
jgi:2,4-dienoyl-CoA reductase (NADPH2)